MKPKSIVDPVSQILPTKGDENRVEERNPVESIELGTPVVYNTLSNYGGYLQ